MLACLDLIAHEDVECLGHVRDVVPPAVLEDLEPLDVVGQQDGDHAQVGVRADAECDLRLRARRVEVDILQQHQLVVPAEGLAHGVLLQAEAQREVLEETARQPLDVPAVLLVRLPVAGGVLGPDVVVDDGRRRHVVEQVVLLVLLALKVPTRRDADAVALDASERPRAVHLLLLLPRQREEGSPHRLQLLRHRRRGHAVVDHLEEPPLPGRVRHERAALRPRP